MSKRADRNGAAQRLAGAEAPTAAVLAPESTQPSPDDFPAFTPASYVRDNVVGLVALALCLVSIVIVLPVLGVNPAGTLLVADILTLVALATDFLDYRRKAAFYRELHGLLAQLRQACVLPSLIAEPSFLEGRIAFFTAARLGQLSSEETAVLRNEAAAYRRYIELWIHETKTPIAAIKLMLANEPGALSAKVARELERVEAQVDQALYYARSTAVERDYAIREVNLAAAAREACKRNTRFLIERGALPAFDIPEDMTVLADEPWLVFMLGQVVTNAAKYGASRIEFTACEEEPGTSRGRTVLEVRDDGCGIPAADVPRVFERGFTGQVGRTHGSATGMGLYLVASLCASMGLHVGLASEEGVGTRVIFTFPHDRTRKELFGA
ncbi:sensor histidine kinase [Eggerthellaceae bacterium 24-137]